MIFCMGSTSTKIIKGNEYLYYVYYENRKKKEVYCGLASKPESEEKALQLELEQLKNEKKNITCKITSIKNKLS